jgi:hypothetical protein
MQYSNHCAPFVRATKKAEYGRRACCGAHAVETRDRNPCRGIHSLSLARSGQDEGGRVEEIRCRKSFPVDRGGLLRRQVLSSYGTLEAAFRRQQRGFKRGNVFIKEQSPVHSFQWHRSAALLTTLVTADVLG